MEYNLNNPIAERRTKTVYRDGDRTIKLFIENYSKAAILNEALIQSRIEEYTDLKISNLLQVTKIENKWAIVTEFVEGKPVNELMDEHPEKEDEYIKFLIDVHLNLLSKRVPMLNRIKDKYRRQLTEATNIDENTKYELLQRLEGLKNHDDLCHGDFRPSNVIVNENGEYAIIDWSHATQGNAAADVAKTFLIMSMDGKNERAAKYLDWYCQETQTSKTEVQRWIPIVAAVQKAKQVPEEQEFLDRWINIVDYE